jgi:hypothetical protein
MLLKVKVVNPKLLGSKYQGMNYYAAKELKQKHKPPKNVVWVGSDLTPRERRLTAAHEKIEHYHMRRGLKYKKADKIALRLEARLRRRL